MQKEPRVLIVDGNSGVSPKALEAMKALLATVGTQGLTMSTNKGVVQTTLKELTKADEERLQLAAAKRARKAAKRIR